MNTKKILLVVLTMIFALLCTANRSFAYKDANKNEYSAEVSKTSVVTDDEVELTLKIKVVGKIYGTQGRIEYDPNLTLLDKKITNGNFIKNENRLTINNKPSDKVISYAIADSKKIEPGDYVIIKLKFEVTGLVGGKYQIKWKDYNSDGYFDIDTVELTRTDVNDKSDENTDGDKDVIDIIDDEINGNGGSSGQGSNNGGNSNGQRGSNSSSNDDFEGDSDEAGISESSNKGRGTKLPSTGDGAYIGVAIVAIVGFGICVYIRLRKVER